MAAFAGVVKGKPAGWGITLTAVFFLLQTWQADKFVSLLYGPPASWSSMMESFFGKEEGLYGIPVGIMSSVLILFIIFSAFVAMTGVGDFFVRLATALAGRLTGGPAKVSVFSSALLGTISGSGVANVMMDGVFTIPMMKRIGYGATFAAAVEAVASIGGQIMPPIMAAAAFIMSDFVGVPFRQVAVAATIPAVLYFFCVYSPALLMIGPWSEILLAAARAGLGIFCMAAGFQGWLRGPTTLAERSVLLAAAVLLIVPYLIADAVGLVLFAAVWARQVLRRVPGAAPAPAATLD